MLNFDYVEGCLLAFSVDWKKVKQVRFTIWNVFFNVLKLLYFEFCSGVKLECRKCFLSPRVAEMKSKRTGA